MNPLDEEVKQTGSHTMNINPFKLFHESCLEFYNNKSTTDKEEEFLKYLSEKYPETTQENRVLYLEVCLAYLEEISDQYLDIMEKYSKRMKELKDI